jgi:SAM-dependent methyltransferase
LAGLAYLDLDVSVGAGASSRRLIKPMVLAKLIQAADLKSTDRVLDVGCATGRHAFELAARGMVVHGVDISERFVEIARSRVDDERRSRLSFERLDARALPFAGPFVGSFDAVVCLCQGAFGMMTADGDDDAVVAGMARALRRGGQLALTAFNAYFAVRYHVDADFDAATGVSHERTEIRSEIGEPMATDLWTGCYTPRELRLLLGTHGLAVRSMAGVEPGAYGSDPVTTESPELLVIAARR